MNLRRVWAIAHKEWREIVRDRLYSVLAFLLPAFFMLVFGYGMATEVEHVSLAAIDHDRSAMSRDYIQRFAGSRYFAFQGYLAGDAQADRRLAGGDTRVVLVIPPRFGADLRAGKVVHVQTLLDATFTTPTRTVQGYVEAINAAASGDIRVAHLAQRAGIPRRQAALWLAPIELEVRYLYNQETRAINGVAPGLIMFILTLIVPLLMALSVVREKETGSILNIYASTVTRGEYLLGKLLPNIAIAAINTVVLWLLAVFYFGVAFKGDAWFFAGATLAYIVCLSGIGLFVSLLVRTQQAAIIISVVFSVIVCLQFSGFIAPVFSMTGANYVLAHLFPSTYYQTIVQGAFLKGTGFARLWPNLLVFLGLALALGALCHRMFRKRTRS